MGMTSTLPAVRATRTIVNSCSTAGKSVKLSLPDASYTGAKTVLSGAVTADTLKTALEITGSSGKLTIAATNGVDATARTHRIVVTLDGVVAFDSTSASIASTSLGLVAVGQPNIDATGYLEHGKGEPFNYSCKVEFTSSLTETDKQNVFYAYTLD